MSWLFHWRARACARVCARRACRVATCLTEHDLCMPSCRVARWLAGGSLRGGLVIASHSKVFACQGACLWRLRVSREGRVMCMPLVSCRASTWCSGGVERWQWCFWEWPAAILQQQGCLRMAAAHACVCLQARLCGRSVLDAAALARPRTVTLVSQ